MRDPMLALGCRDPAERVAEAKATDPARRAAAELFEAWWRRHEGRPVTAADLDDEVRGMADPHGRGRQHLASRLQGLAGTRTAGFVLTKQEPAGRWGAATYALRRTADGGGAPPGGHGHRSHRDHGAEGAAVVVTAAPVTPMLDAVAGDADCEGVL